jgi:tetratricopeptide (TPR) repeat protein
MARDGDLEAAERLAGEALEEAGRRDLRRTKALALQALGIVRAAREEGEAEDLFHQAEDLFDHLGLEPSLARCKMDHGMALIALGRKGRAREQLEAAVKILDENRMAYDLDRARRALKGLRGRGGKDR